MILLRMLRDLTGSAKSKMAARKSEVTISQLVDKLATKFTWLPLVSRVQHSNGTNDYTVGFNRKYKIQDGGQQTKSNDISACRQDSVLYYNI